jgi:hypothetical protein
MAILISIFIYFAPNYLGQWMAVTPRKGCYYDYTICWELFYNDLTQNISLYISSLFSKTSSFRNNQQETIKTLGSSETICVTSENFNNWLAGLIDGDGSLLINKQGYGSCEITLDEEDIQTLYFIKKFLNYGNITKRSNVKAYRIRINKIENIKNLLNRINGKLYTPERSAQFIKISKIYNITPLFPNHSYPLNFSWLSGFIDAQGYFSTSKAGSLTISIGQKNPEI